MFAITGDEGLLVVDFLPKPSIMSEPSAFPGSVLTLLPKWPAALTEVLVMRRGITVPSMATPFVTNVNAASAMIDVDPAYCVERRVIATTFSQLEHSNAEEEQYQIES